MCARFGDHWNSLRRGSSYADDAAGGLNEGIFTIFALAPAVSGTYCLWRLVSKYVA
jgi:hypothetical protein